MTLRELGHDLMPLEDVQQTILSHIEPLPAEKRPLADVFDLVLREALTARELLPPFDNSAMDGYAVRAIDLASAAEEAPARLPLQGAGIAAGSPGGEPLEQGRTVRIMTGAPLPPGADAVVPHELTRTGGGSVSFFRPVKPGQNIRRAGGDMRPGDTPLVEGTILKAPQLAIAAALGYREVRVSPRPRVAVLSPGDELVGIDETPGPGKIRNSNAYSLAGALREAGAEPLDLGIVADRKDAILEAVRRGHALGADAVLSSGGVSAGDFDFVRAVVDEEADPGYVFKVAMRPGKPQVFGLVDGRPLFGLPGNPAASIVSFEVLVRPALRKMRGESRWLPETFMVRFSENYRYKAGRVFLLRTRLEPDPAGGFRVAPPGPQDSSFLASLARANAIVVLPAEKNEVEAGSLRPAFWLGGARP